MMINTRADLEALRGTDFWPTALRLLAGATVQWRNTAGEGEAPVWEQIADLSGLERVQMSTDDLAAELAAAGIVADPPQAPPVVTPPPPPPSFLARELLEELADDDLVKIEAATASNASLRRLWVSMLGQGDAPIRADAERFLAGWAGLTQALGDRRAAEIARELGIPA